MTSLLQVVTSTSLTPEHFSVMYCRIHSTDTTSSDVVAVAQVDPFEVLLHVSLRSVGVCLVMLVTKRDRRYEIEQED